MSDSSLQMVAYGQHTGVDLYNNGWPLWTKKMLEDIQRQIDVGVQLFHVPGITGVVHAAENKAFGDDPLNWSTVVVFHGLTMLRVPQINSKGQYIPHRTCTIIQTRRDPPDVWLNDLELYDEFQMARQSWEHCHSRLLLDDALSKYELPSSIDKVVCFGLGNDIAARRQMTMSQYPAALTIREYLEKRLGREVRLLTQDPEYDVHSKAVLESHGFEVIGQNGIQGFLELDNNSVVISLAPGTCVTQIIAEIAKPAVFISLSPHSFINSIRESIHPHALDNPPYAMLDPQTPRTEAMLAQYYKHPCLAGLAVPPGFVP